MRNRAPIWPGRPPGSKRSAGTQLQPIRRRSLRFRGIGLKAAWLAAWAAVAALVGVTEPGRARGWAPMVARPALRAAVIDVPKPASRGSSRAKQIPRPSLPVIPADALSVRAFGARGDGIVNDRPAIQAAVDAAKPGATVYCPAGTYRLDDAIKVRQSRLTLMGDGARSVIQHGGVTGFQLGTHGEPLTGLVVKRLKFEGLPGRYKKQGAGGHAIQVFGPRGTVISDCDFRGPGYAVFNAGAVGTTYGTRIENCRVQGWGAVAIFCNGGEQVTNCRLIQDDPDRLGEQSSHGFYIHSGCTDVLIADTLIQNARKYAAQIYGQDVGTTTARITFRNDTIKDCANGITIQQNQPSAARAQNVVIQGCTITNTYNGPALSIKQGDGIRVLNNVIDGGSVGLQLGVWAPYEPGFSITNLQASGNVIRNCQTGIWAVASNGGRFVDVSLIHNRVTHCQKPVDLAQARSISYSP